MQRLRLLTLASLMLLHATLPADSVAQKSSALQAKLHGEWKTWWTSAHAPTRWVAALPSLDEAIAWRNAAAGLDWGSLDVSADGQGWRTKVIVVRIDPRRYRFNLEALVGEGGTSPQWTVDAAGADAILAMNAGQFEGASPWGWVVHGGHEARPPRPGPLSSAVVFEAAGNVTLVDAASIATVRNAGFAFEAFQSYPTLLTGDGDVPQPILSGDGIDINHRDSRLAIGELRDGRIMFVLTRFDGLGGVASSAPLGLTIPELSALMGALGCRRAVSLDGGLSSQLLLRDRDGSEHLWKGWRKVPMGLVAIPKGEK